jgi:outer membrane protein TolC
MIARNVRKLLVPFLAASLLAQQSAVVVDRPQGSILFRPYRQTHIPEVQLKNTPRIYGLIRAGKLYLTVQDAIALAIENNLDLEVDRYGPLRAQWQLERMNGGGPLRGVQGGNNVVNQVTGGQGVLGAQSAAGLLSGNGGGGGGGGNGAVVSQIGAITPNLDAVLQNSTAFTHFTYPQQNAIISQTPALVQTQHIFNTFVQQGLITGGYVQIAANETYQKENAPTDILNPSTVPVVNFYLRHQLLQGRGIDVNSRYIRVARKNIGLAFETFRSDLLTLVARVLNLYWELVSDNDQVKARQRTLDVAQHFYDDTKHRIEIGVVSKVDIFRAQGELETRRRELAIAQATVRQQENLLKDVLSRNGLADPLLDAAEIVPLDRIEVPEKDELPPLRELLATALAKRPDIAMSAINNETGELNALGTINGLLPGSGVIASVQDRGLSGTGVPQPDGSVANPYFVGGLGTALAQVFRRNFPTERIGAYIQPSLRNRGDQADYAIDQLQLRQGDLVERRSRNQLVVDISNTVVAVRQARARYSAAVDTRVLDEQLLEKEQQKFSLGASTIDDLIPVQRNAANAQVAEVAALLAYSRARVFLDQVLGETLEKNHVSVKEALAKQ